MIDPQHGSDITIKFLFDKNGYLLKRDDEIYEAIYKPFPESFGRGDRLDHCASIRDFLAGGLRLSVRKA